MPSGQDAIHAARKGDLQAFNRLVVEHQDLAYTLAFVLLGDERLAAEATQAAFVRAYRDLGSFQRGSFRGWLLRQVLAACQNLAPTMDRKTRLDPLRPGMPAAGQEGVRHKLRTLPVECCVVAVLVDLLGMDYEEAAQAAGCTPRALSHRLARARAELSGFISPSPIGGEGFGG